MHKYKKIIATHKELTIFIVFVVTTLSILTITLVLVQSNQDTRSSAASGTCTADLPISLDIVEQEFLVILNNHRESLGRQRLRASETLTKAAQWQAEDMIEHGYRSHTDSTGRGAQQRLAECGIGGNSGGENIVWSTTSAQNAFDRWMASPGHKANMEDARWSQIGISRMLEPQNTWVWVNTFSIGNDGTEPDLDNTTDPTPTPPVATNPTSSPQPTNQPLPTPTLSITPNPDPPANPKTVKFSFRIPGVGGNTALGENPNPKQDFLVAVGVVDSLEEDLLDFRAATVVFDNTNFTFNSEVDFDESILLPDNFIWITLLKSNVHQIIIKSLPQGEAINLPTLLFRMGDYNLDTNFDLNDYIDLVSCIKGIYCFYGYEFYDINLDGKVDIVDLNILLRSIINFNP